MTVSAQVVHGQLPEGQYVVAGPATVPGAGIFVASVDAGRFVSREITLAVSYRASANGSVRGVGTIGGAIRLLSARRTVLDAPRSPLDVDVGFRLGPALLFRFHETAIERHKRFTLVADPFVRFGFQSLVNFSVELGIHRPALRLGVWIPI